MDLYIYTHKRFIYLVLFLCVTGPVNYISVQSQLLLADVSFRIYLRSGDYISDVNYTHIKKTLHVASGGRLRISTSLLGSYKVFHNKQTLTFFNNLSELVLLQSNNMYFRVS